MKIARKFSLESIGKRYESIVVEVEGDGTAEELIQKIESAYQAYVNLILGKKVT